MKLMYLNQLPNALSERARKEYIFHLKIFEQGSIWSRRFPFHTALESLPENYRCVPHELVKIGLCIVSSYNSFTPGCSTVLCTNSNVVIKKVLYM